MSLNEAMNRFRMASRELFNHYFSIPEVVTATSGPMDQPEPANDGLLDLAWDLKERFSEVEELLYDKMVGEQAGIAPGNYGHPQPEIVVELNSAFCPVMLNRELDSGYWDFPIEEITSDARLSFLRFFDWNVLANRDNQYVLVRVDAWLSHPETAGKRALIEARHVHFVLADKSCWGKTD
jgi:hypothetical protein